MRITRQVRNQQIGPSLPILSDPKARDGSLVRTTYRRWGYAGPSSTEASNERETENQ